MQQIRPCFDVLIAQPHARVSLVTPLPQNHAMNHSCFLDQILPAAATQDGYLKPLRGWTLWTQECGRRHKCLIKQQL